MIDETNQKQVQQLITQLQAALTLQKKEPVKTKPLKKAQIMRRQISQLWEAKYPGS